MFQHCSCSTEDYRSSIPADESRDRCMSLIKRVASGLRSVMPNAAWDVIKAVGKWAYNNPGTLAVIIGAISSAMAYLINRVRGLPPDLIGVLAVFGFAVLVTLIGYLIGRVKDKRAAPEKDQISKKSAESDLVESPKCQYDLIHRIADHQAKNIRDFVTVSRVGVWDDELNNAVPTIKWGFMIKNNSILTVSFIEAKNNVFFETTELAEKRFEDHNEAEQLGYGRQGSVVFKQRLSPLEAQHIRNTPEGKFRFNRLEIKVANPNSFPVIEPQEIRIGDDLETTLNVLAYKETEGMKRLKDEIYSLRQQLEEQTSNVASGGKQTEERKALIASWRASVAKVYREYHESGYSFTGLLATQDDYMSLTPNLSPETKTAIEDATPGDYTDVRRLVNILAEDIARIEREWGL